MPSFLDFKNYLLLIHKRQALIEPDIHLVGTTMIPGIVRNQGEVLNLDRNDTFLLLVQDMSKCRNCLDFEGRSTLGLLVLNAVVIHQGEVWLLPHDGAEYWLVLIIHSLSAIYQWSTLYGNLTLIICNLRVGNYCAYRHIEVDADDIALLDVLDREITLVGIEVSLHSLAVYGYAISRLLGIAILVKVARHHLVANPSRNTDQEVGILYAALLHSNLDIAVPRILGSLLQNHILAIHLDGRCIAGKEIHIDIVVLHAIEITRNGRDETAQVTWAAGTSEPRLAGGVAIGIELILAIARQWVWIEESATIHAHTRDDTII